MWKIVTTFAPVILKTILFTANEKTNTYWRYRAIVCEDSRFILLYYWNFFKLPTKYGQVQLNNHK